MKRITRKRIEIFLEFLLFGVAMGLMEDLIALKLATGEPITWRVVGIVTLVAIPFAILGELVVDRMKIVPDYNGSSQSAEVASKPEGKSTSLSVKMKEAKRKKVKI